MIRNKLNQLIKTDNNIAITINKLKKVYANLLEPYNSIF